MHEYIDRHDYMHVGQMFVYTYIDIHSSTHVNTKRNDVFLYIHM